MVVGSGPWQTLIGDEASGHVDDGGVVAVVAPSLREVEDLASSLEERFGDAVYRASSSLPARDVTRAWREAGRPGRIVVGTRELAAWHLPLVRLAIVVEPGRRALKARQTPTVHAWDLLRHRSRVERFALLALGAVPSGEIAASGLPIESPPGRPWPLVEIVDRSEAGPGGSLIVDRTRQAIRSTVAREGRVFVHVPRRGYAPAFRCVRCGTVRRCLVCGAGPDRGDTCRRCGAATGPCVTCGSGRFQAIGAAVGRVVDDLRRAFGDHVGTAGTNSVVTVGTERDLPAPGSVDLAVAIDPDGLWLAPNYRAEEEALRVLARVAGTVRHSRGRRCVVQTADPSHRVLAALRSGRGVAFMQEITAERAAAGLPPAASLLAVEIRGDRDGPDHDLRGISSGEAELFGPAAAGDGWRWLLQGGDLHRVRVRLRTAVQGWRDRGWAVRIDADPLDL